MRMSLGRADEHMSTAAAQADKFRQQVARERRAYTFTEGGQLLVYKTASGETVPFWSSRSRLTTIQKRLPRYQAYTISELSLEAFQSRLDQLERDGIKVGLNWSGAGLTGYNLPVADVRASIAYYLGVRSFSAPEPPA